jgi:hypothetical protein
MHGLAGHVLSLFYRKWGGDGGSGSIKRQTPVVRCGGVILLIYDGPMDWFGMKMTDIGCKAALPNHHLHRDENRHRERNS